MAYFRLMANFLLLARSARMRAVFSAISLTRASERTSGTCTGRLKTDDKAAKKLGCARFGAIRSTSLANRSASITQRPRPCSNAVACERDHAANDLDTLAAFAGRGEHLDLVVGLRFRRFVAFVKEVTLEPRE